MALQVKVGSFTLNNVVGNQSIASVGFQPDLVIFFSPGDVGFNVNYNRMYGGIGFAASPAKQACMSWFSRADVTPSITSSLIDDSYVYTSINNAGAGAPFIEQRASLVSMDPLGFTLSVGFAGNPDLICYMALAGLTGVDVGITPMSSLGAPDSVVTGFTPDLVLVGTSGLYNAVGALVDNQTAFFGVADGTGNHSTSWFRRDNVAFNVDRGGAESVSGPVLLQDLSGATVASASIGFLANGFTLNKSLPPASTQNVLYAAIAGLKTTMGTVLMDEVALANKVVTGVGFQPVGGLFHSMYRTPLIGDTGNRFHFGVQAEANATLNNSAMAVSWNGNDEPSTVEDRTRAHNNKCFSAADATTLLEAGDILTWDVDGFTFRNSNKTITATFPVANLVYTVFEEGTNNNFIPTGGGCLRENRCEGSLGFLVGQFEPFCINQCSQILTEEYDTAHEKVYDLGVDYLDFDLPTTLLIQELANFLYRDDPLTIRVRASDDSLFAVVDEEIYNVTWGDLVGPEARDFVTSLGFTTMRRYWKVTIETLDSRRVIVGDVFLGAVFTIDRSPAYPATFIVRDEFVEAKRFPLDLELTFKGVSPVVKARIDDKLITDHDIVPIWLYDPQDAVLFGRIVQKSLITEYNVKSNDSGYLYEISMTLEELL